MIAALTNHLWQSTLFVIAAAFVAFALRKNGAHVRHRVWLIASLKFLVPFSLLMSLGRALPTVTPIAPATSAAVSDLSVTVDRFVQPFSDDVLFASAPATKTQQTTNWTAAFVVATWACGFIAIVIVRVRAWQRIRAAVRESAPVEFATVRWAANLTGFATATPVGRSLVRRPKVRATYGILEPGVVGLWRPVLLMPAGIEQQLTPRQLETVLTHELCHVQRRDNLTSAVHMVVEAVFWFHPLVWFVGARLLDERERACDEHVLRVCGEPQTYAESILSIVKLYVESPLACISGVSGADLKKRVAAIVSNRIGLRLSTTRRTALIVAALLAVSLPLMAGMLVAPLHASLFAQTAADKVKKFDVASVKPCGPEAPASPSRAGGGGQSSPDYLNLSCLTLKQFVSMAYAGPDHPLLNRHGGADYVPDFPKSVRGGPGWAYSETFTIEAKADGVTDRSILTGSMLRALLEDRFQLKMHRATEQQSMYALTVAKSGLKIKPLAPGECWEFEPGMPNPPHDDNVGPCGSFGGDGWGSTEASGVWLGDPTGAREGFRMVDMLWRVLLRNVVDRTGLNGRYSFTLNFTPDDTTAGVHGRCGGSPDCMARLAADGIHDERPTTFKSDATIFQALEQQLGLHLELTKAPAEYIVIDSAERPKPNPPTPIAPAGRGFGGASQPPSRAQGAGK